MSVQLRVYPAAQRLLNILDPQRPICREDLIWVLDYIKKKVADGDPFLKDLPQPRLLDAFYCFAEAAMLLIHRRTADEQEFDRLRALLAESLRGSL